MKRHLLATKELISLTQSHREEEEDLRFKKES